MLYNEWTAERGEALKNVKMLDVKQTDEISGHGIAGHENAKHENVLAYITQTFKAWKADILIELGQKAMNGFIFS